MTTPNWKLVKNPITQQDTVWREWPDGRQESCLVTDQAYLKWLEEGNTPEPADEPADV
jgi:hypothetical protein